MSVADAPAPAAPPAPPWHDLLARRRIVPAGPHVARIVLVLAGVLAVGVGAYWLTDRDSQPGRPVVTRFEQRPAEPRLPTYADLAAPAEPVAPPKPRIELPQATTAQPPDRPRAATPQKDQLWDKALDAGVGGWRRSDQERQLADASGAATAVSTAAPAVSTSQFTPAPGGCFVPPGTPIEAQTINRVVTERAGIVTALVTRDLWSAGFDCLAVPAGSTLTMAYATSVSRGQKRIEILDPTIVRPWPRNDTVTLAAMTADATGASGLPGRVDVPWFRTGVLIAASTATDLGVAALSGGGSLLGALLGRNLDRPLDQAAKNLLERTPVITLEAGESILVVLRGGLVAEEFRDVR